MTIFWLTMMGIFVYQEIIQPSSFIFARGNSRNARAFFKLPLRQEWMGIYYRDSKVGFSYTTISPKVIDGEEGYNITNKTKLSLAMSGEEYNLSLDGYSFVDNLYKMKRFEMKVVSGQYCISLKGESSGDIFSITVRSAGEVFHKEIEMEDETLLANTLTPFYVLPTLYPGRSFSVSIIDPLTLTLGRAEVKVGEKEDYIFRGQKRRVMPVEVTYRGISSRALVTEGGEILREETPLGWVMVKEDRAEALKWIEEKKEKVDLAYAVAIPVEKKIPYPEKVAELRLKITGVDMDILDNGRQKVIDKKNGIVVIRKQSSEEKHIGKVEEYIKGDVFIQVDDRDIVATARKIVGEEKGLWEMAKRLNKWLYKNIEKYPTLSIPSAVEVLKIRQGDCNEHTILFTAMARSLKIPTKVCVGLVYLRGYFFYHAWPEIFEGKKWIAVDPTLGEEIADATHIKLAEGGIESQIEIARLIGNIDIEVLEYKYD